MTRTRRVGAIVAVAFFVALAMLAAPGMAASPTTDSETTDTSTTSDLTDGTVLNGWEANGDNYSWIEASYDSQNASVEIEDPDTGVIHASNSSMKQTAAVDTDASGTNDTWYYAWNMSHSELETMPHGASENKSVTIRFINDTSLDNPDTTEITVYLEAVDDRAVVYAGDQAAAGNVAGLDAETENKSSRLPDFLSSSDDSKTTIRADNVDLGNNASGTEVHVVAANTSDADTFSEAEDGGWFASYGEGDYIPTHQLHLEGHKHAVFHSSAPTEDLATGYTYAETSTLGGHDAYTIHVDDDFEDQTTLDVKTVANEKYGFNERRSIRADAYGSGWNYIFSPGMIMPHQQLAA